MSVSDNDLKAMEKGYCCKVTRFPQTGDSLYIRPNKIYQVGNIPDAAIQVGDSPVLICTLVCDKEANVVIETNPKTSDIVKVNDIVMKKKQLLNHLDIITIGSGQLQFLSFFNNGRVRLNCKNLHCLLLHNYPIFEKELKSIEGKTTSLREYRKGLRNIFIELDKKDKDKIQKCREMFKEVLNIVMDDNPPAKLQIECLKAGIDIRNKYVTISNDDNNSTEQLKTPVIKPSSQRQIKMNHNKEKSTLVDTTASILLNFDENEDDDFEEFRKHQLQSFDDQLLKKKELD
ncbi:hypothetical protein ENUP19_0204G0001 [Entamoeba nuttalli]|uniref:FHA domain-containing protein n=1 Tax=Entamoeba nuttalli TaxID=412467 RepID=A0ABQ0DNS2_9EUKA